MRHRGRGADRRRRRVRRRAAPRQHRLRGRRRDPGRRRRCPTPSPDDLYMVCTGGTTGRPKAVLWRQERHLRLRRWAAPRTPPPSRSRPRRPAGRGRGSPCHRSCTRPPSGPPSAGSTRAPPIVLHDDRGRSTPPRSSTSPSGERCVLMSIVGDAYARPLVEELRRRPYDLSSLLIIGTGGRGHQRAAQGGPARAAAARDDHRRLRRVRDRRHGLRRPQPGPALRRAFMPERWRPR